MSNLRGPSAGAVVRNQDGVGARHQCPARVGVAVAPVAEDGGSVVCDANDVRLTRDPTVAQRGVSFDEVLAGRRLNSCPHA